MIRTAQVLPGSETPTGEGVFGALRCTIELPDGGRRAAVLKRLPLGQVAAEAFSALLLRAWGLQVPEPFLVPEPGGLAFASADATYPSLYKRLGLCDLPQGPAREAAVLIGAAIACALPSAGLAAAADEAIDNRDRNLGNILWDGKAEAWIDHACALGTLQMNDVNKLCEMALLTGTHEALRTSAVAHALLLDRAAPQGAASSLPAAFDSMNLAAQVATRLAALAARLLARFPSPRDLLSGT